MADYAELRRKFPAKKRRKTSNAAKIKAIAREYEMKKAALRAGAPDVRRRFPYYMAIIIGMLLATGLAGSAIFRRGGIDIAGRDLRKARESLRSLAVALGRYRYHTGEYPSTEEGLERLASKNVPVRGWNGPYIRRLNADPWKNPYVYIRNEDPAPPVLYSRGPDGEAGTTDDVIADPASFEEPFRDISWTRGWVPMHLRDIVVAQDAAHKKALEDEVRGILSPAFPASGEASLCDSWRVGAGPGVWTRRVEIPAQAAGKSVSLVFTCLPGAWKVFADGAEVASGADGADGAAADLSKFTHPGRALEIAVSTAVPDACTRGGAWVAGEVLLRVGGDAAAGAPAFPVPPAITPLPSAEMRLVALQEKCGFPGGVFSRDAARRFVRAAKEAGATAVCALAPCRAWREACAEGGLAVVPPARSCLPQLFDHALFPTPAFTVCRAAWRRDVPTLRFLDDWNRAAAEGEAVNVSLATDAGEAELFVNGESAGKRRAGESGCTANVLSWTVPWEPGELKAIAYDGGIYAGETSVRTAGSACALKVTSEEKSAADGSLTFFTVEAVDENGLRVPGESREVVLSAEGPGELVVAVSGIGAMARQDADGRIRIALCMGRVSVAARRAPGGSALPLKVSAAAKDLRTGADAVRRR